MLLLFLAAHEHIHHREQTNGYRSLEAVRVNCRRMSKITWVGLFNSLCEDEKHSRHFPEMLLFTFSGISKIRMTIRSDVELLNVEASYPVATSNSCKIHLPLPNLSTPLATELFLTKRSVGRGRNTKRRKGEWRMKGCRTVVVPVSWTIEENADWHLLFRWLLFQILLRRDRH